MGINKEMYECVQEAFIQEMKKHPKKDAIPIEWIKNKIAVNVHLWEEGKEKMFIEDGAAKIVSYSLTAQALTQLLEWWEKENG
jgi:hypothetical protein